MTEHRKQWSIRLMCHALQASTSGYYAWAVRQKAPPSPTKRAQQERGILIKSIVHESRKIYGYRKIHAALRRQGMNCAINTVREDCKRLGIRSITRKKFRVRTTDSNHNLPVAKNVLNRDFKAEKPNERWVTDITYVETQEGWLYAAAIIDLFSRKVIGYAMADHMRAELVVDALQMALGRRRKIFGEIWLHSDRGVQFSSEQFREVLNLVGIEQSMSRKGNCWDNAPCESFFGKLKNEWIYPKGVYVTRKEAERAIMEYIEMFYNSMRLHQALDYRTPNEVEAEYCVRSEELIFASQ
jgi:transposase InsO family protein